MSDKWLITFTDGTEEQPPADVERLTLDRSGAVWMATGPDRNGGGGTETQAMYPVVNVRKVVRIR